MEFEFDKRKSLSNKDKCGIEFQEAQLLWHDLDRIEIPARTEAEPRYLVISQLKGKHYSVVITYRGEKVRIISVRRARVEEVEIYESKRV
jgi:uncharacterized DUF497 family protein